MLYTKIYLLAVVVAGFAVVVAGFAVVAAGVDLVLEDAVIMAELITELTQQDMQQ